MQKRFYTPQLLQEIDHHPVAVWGFEVFIDLQASAESTDEVGKFPMSVFHRVRKIVNNLQEHPRDYRIRYFVEMWPSNYIRINASVDQVKLVLALCEEQNLVAVKLHPIHH